LLYREGEKDSTLIPIETYMVLGGENAGVGTVEPSDELGHAVPHLPHLLLARERVHHEVPWNQTTRRVRVPTSIRAAAFNSPPIARRPGARGRGDVPERRIGALTIGLEEAELVGGEATGRRHGEEAEAEGRGWEKDLTGTVE
jgi:hypothetical protein